MYMQYLIGYDQKVASNYRRDSNAYCHASSFGHRNEKIRLQVWVMISQETYQQGSEASIEQQLQSCNTFYHGRWNVEQSCWKGAYQANKDPKGVFWVAGVCHVLKDERRLYDQGYSEDNNGTQSSLQPGEPLPENWHKTIKLQDLLFLSYPNIQLLSSKVKAGAVWPNTTKSGTYLKSHITNLGGNHQIRLHHWHYFDSNVGCVTHRCRG